MKKKVISISLICILVLGALAGIILPIVYFIRGNFMQNLSEYMVDLDSATAFGISDSVDTARASSVNAVSYAKSNAISDKKHHKNYMVVQKNGSDEVHKVDFKKRHDKDDKDSTISQEDMSAEIDKLYVLGDYTFISFVREGESKRPNDNKLEFDTDGIAFYDKKDYYTDNDRKSYIIDNTTGYIYAIVDFNISKIQGGCLLSKDDNYIYDFKITSNDELEIFSLFTNDTIEWSSCFKDKYGNKYIQNNRLNIYDDTTNTYFYVFNPLDDYNKGNNNYINYELTELGEAIRLEYCVEDDYGNYIQFIKGASIMLANGTSRALTSEDSFKIYYDKEKIFCNSYPSRATYKVQNGVVYTYSHGVNYIDSFCMLKYDAVLDKATYVLNKWQNTHILYYNTSYLEEYGFILEYYNGKVYCYKNMWTIYDAVAQDATAYTGVNENYYREPLFNDSHFVPEVVLENCSISDDKTSFLTYGVNGNTYYEVVVENVNGQVQVNSYVSGTYERPQTKILLQPINK